MKMYLIVTVLNLLAAALACGLAVYKSSIIFYVVAGLFLLSGIINLVLFFMTRKMMK